MVPGFLKSFAATPQKPGSGKKLVVIQLSGGNDGLNTIIPVRNDIYYSSRPGIGIPRDEALTVTDEIGFNPALRGLKKLYDDGLLTLVNGVGYPKPNRSHFRSMDIWQSASGSDEILTTGWLGRYLDVACKDCTAHDTLAIEVDDSLSLSMKGAERKALAIRDAKAFYNAANAPYFNAVAANAHANEHGAALPDYLYKTLRETISSAEYVHEHFGSGKPAETYPDTPLGKRMKTIAALMLGRADTQVYYASHGSFDTHAGQRGRQDKLLNDLDEALAPFVTEMKAAGLMNDVLIMTFSEFGRRVAQNASNGTDHGTAAPMFFISGGLKKSGVYNALPSLQDLDEGDLKYSIDFRDAYATVLKKWLDAPAEKILGRHYNGLTFI
jgi:uncharacterized protein (DUF1501 family)